MLCEQLLMAKYVNVALDSNKDMGPHSFYLQYSHSQHKLYHYQERTKRFVTIL